MPKLILVRHGHVEGIQPERFRGREDVALSAEGERQAAASARCIASRWQPAILYSSPLTRCIQTSQEIAKTCDIEVAVLDDLLDLDYGAWQWRLHSEVRGELPERYARWLAAPQLVRFPGGESLQDLLARTSNVLRLILETYTDQTVVIVGHESGIRAMLLQLLDEPLSAYWRFEQSPCAINEIEWLGSRARLVSLNETQHLRGRGSSHA